MSASKAYAALRYDSLPMKDLSDEDADDDASLIHGRKLTRETRGKWDIARAVIPWIAHVFLLAASATLLVITFLRKPTEAECHRLLSPYSPALEAVELVDMTFEGDFEQPSPWRGPPSPERDAAWEYLTHDGGVNVPLENLHLLNKSTDVDWEKSDPTFGGGAVGLLEVFHQLHCLNTLRKWTYIEWYQDELPPEFDGPEYLQRLHIDHCIEMLRLSLMCTADVTPVLAWKDPEAPLGKRADFSTFHRCRNFDKIKSWMSDHRVMD
ncbi:Cyclochlorotine biosynthesis protein O [Colletotrichum orbiculare MAFF 240422]|uniref:Cyclochlorotine biosynthesis protein O n=1 Tax=Colletotrichum orbiculare (strain 104-T / ATCC 96160 / CBS 514.97 / LARS 414 / MAFF 240422) TaxID=1213857 RepID=A0A484FTL2_COLOR|nr:Cyclochlorotine biosynthesis protein O [Colletotrichum orbiculare MAFF 240422]